MKKKAVQGEKLGPGKKLEEGDVIRIDKEKKENENKKSGGCC